MNQEKNKIPIKILFISDLTFIHTVGGTEVATARLLNGFAREEGYEIYLFSGKTKGGILRGELPDSNIHIHRFLFFGVPGDKGFNNFVVPNPFRMWRLVQKIHPDIIHIHCPSFFGICGIMIGKYFHIPLVYTANMFTEHFTSRMGPKLRPIGIFFFDTLLKWYTGLFDVVIYPSKIQQDKDKEKYHLQNRSVVISNGYIPTNKIYNFSRKDEWQGKIVFFTVSRIAPEKNIETIIDAFDMVYIKNPDIILTIVGDGVTREKLEYHAQQKRSSSKIVFTGEQLGEDLEYYYTMCDVFVATSDKESEGLTTLEAISHGKPIILSDAHGNAAKQFLCDNGYLFQSGNSHDLASKMLNISHQRELFEVMKKKSLEKAQEFDFSHSLSKFKDVYNTLLPKKIGQK